MKAIDKIVAEINRIDAGDLFGFDNLGLNSHEVIADSKALSRLVDKGVIRGGVEKVIFISQKFPYLENKNLKKMFYLRFVYLTRINKLLILLEPDCIIGWSTLLEFANIQLIWIFFW